MVWPKFLQDFSHITRLWRIRCSSQILQRDPEYDCGIIIARARTCNIFILHATHSISLLHTQRPFNLAKDNCILVYIARREQHYIYFKKKSPINYIIQTMRTRWLGRAKRRRQPVFFFTFLISYLWRHHYKIVIFSNTSGLIKILTRLLARNSTMADSMVQSDFNERSGILFCILKNKK